MFFWLTGLWAPTNQLTHVFDLPWPLLTLRRHILNIKEPSKMWKNDEWYWTQCCVHKTSWVVVFHCVSKPTKLSTILLQIVMQRITHCSKYRTRASKSVLPCSSFTFPATPSVPATRAEHRYNRKWRGRVQGVRELTGKTRLDRARQ